MRCGEASNASCSATYRVRDRVRDGGRGRGCATYRVRDRVRDGGRGRG